MKYYIVPENRNYWSVRAGDSNKFTNNFIKNGVVAIGHLDSLEILDNFESPELIDADNLRSELEKLHLSWGMSQKSSTTYINEAFKFLYDIKIADWVITMDKYHIWIGVVTSIAKTIYSNEEPSIDNRNLNYRVYREVSWSEAIPRNKIPARLKSSLGAIQTLHSLNSYWDEIYYLLYPVFSRKDKIYISTIIKNQDNIKNTAILNYLHFINMLEFAIKETDSELTAENFEDRYLKFEHKITATVQADFHSPGEIYNIIHNISGDMTPYVIMTFAIYLMATGNEKLGIKGIPDFLELKRKLRQLDQEAEQKDIELKMKNLEQLKAQFEFQIKRFSSLKLGCFEMKTDDLEKHDDKLKKPKDNSND